jgi:hypothetical protein
MLRFISVGFVLAVVWLFAPAAQAQNYSCTAAQAATANSNLGAPAPGGFFEPASLQVRTNLSQCEATTGAARNAANDGLEWGSCTSVNANRDLLFDLCFVADRGAYLIDFVINGPGLVNASPASDEEIDLAAGTYSVVAQVASTGVGAADKTHSFSFTITEISTDNQRFAESDVLVTVADIAPPAPTVTLSGGGSASEAAGTRTITATLSSSASTDTVVNLAYSGTAAGAGSDYSAAASITILAGNTTGTTNISVVDDGVVEVDETVIVDIASVSGGDGATEDGTQQQTFTITNDDSATVTIADVAGNEDDGAITVTVTLDNAVDGGFDVDVSTTDGTATLANSDYTAVTNQTLTFAGTASESQTFTITPTSDVTAEANETVLVLMSNLVPVTVAGGDLDITDGATVTINNDDSISITVDDPSVAENTGTLSFTVSLSTAAPAGGATVDYATSNGTATAGSDYTAASGTVSFAVGETSKTVGITLSGDSTVEVDETLTLTLSGATGTSVTIGDATGTGTITNDDAATVTIADVTVNENAGTATVTLALDNAVDGGFDVDVSTADGTATTADSDYTAVVSATETFAGTAGETQSFDITLGGDTKVEADETISVSMSGLVPVTVSSGNITITDTATVTITNDDSATVTIADVAGNEDDGAITVTVTLDNAVDGGFDVDVSTTDGTATLANSDYTAVTNQTLTFAGTASESQTFTITPTSDVTAEANETVLVLMSNLVPVTVAGGDLDITDGATVTINNDDEAVAPTVLSIVRSNPVSATTNADALTWRVTFDEAVQNVTTADFSLTGTTAGATFVSPVSTSVYDITASGGDLAGLGASTVSLGFDGSQDITDLAGNALVVTAPSGANESYTVNNSAPVLANITRQAPTGAITNADSLTWDLSWSQISNAFSLAPSDFTLTGTTATLSVVRYSIGFTVTASGGDLADLDGVVTLELNAGIVDEFGNVMATPLPSGTNDNTYTVDNTAPTLTSVDLFAGTVSPTNADVVSFQAVFSEDLDLTTISGADFVSTGTTATPTSSSVSNSEFEISLAGGDMADLNATVTVALAASPTISDIAGNALADTAVQGTNNNSVDVLNDTTPPDVLITTASTDPVSGVFSVTIEFTESVTGFAVGDITVGNGSASNFAGSGDTYTADITPAGDGAVTVDVAAGVAQDAAGNANTAATQFSIEADGSAPGVAISSTATDPVSGVFQVTITFDEDVTGFDVTDLSVGNGSAGNFAGSGTTYTADITPATDGPVTVDVAAGAAQDAAGNDNTAATQFSIEADGSAPQVSIGSTAVGPINAAFSITVDFTEAVTGFELADLIVSNGTASNFAGSGDSYTADITPTADGFVTVEVLDAVAQDAAGNDNAASEEPFSIAFDATPPELSITTVSDAVSGPFEATFTFTEEVTGFELADIIVANGAASALSGSGAVYTATITPDAPGPLFIDVAAGAVVDVAGNDNVAGQTRVDVVTQAPTVALVLSSQIADPGDVAGTATLSNPGSNPLPFSALADVIWVDVSPSSGTIPGLADLDLTIALNDEVNSLEPGVYNGVITVTLGAAAATPASSNATTQSTVTQLDIPIQLTVEERFGTVELVAVTPSGASGEASFTYGSDIEAFDGLTLTTSAGRASASASDVLQGAYQITQSAPAGWRVESISCAGDADGGSTFDVATGQAVLDLDPGEALVCTFENVRDEDVVRLATQRAIRNFMARRADRIIEAAPDLSRRFDERATTQRGSMGADVDGSGRYQMNFTGSLSGLRNASAGREGAAQFTNPERAFLEGWDVWLAAEVSGVSDNRAGERADSDFGVAQLGVDYQLSDTLIVGALAQYDWMSESAQEIFQEAGAVRGARVEGEGWMAGPYGVWRIADALILDGLVLYGRSDNQVDPLGLYEDDFETERFMVRANLTGEFVSGAWRLRPQAGLTHFEETQSAYTDSLGIVIPEQTLALGRLRAGPQVAWRHERAQGGWLELSTTFNAVWDYQAAELLNEAGVAVAGDEDLRADARFALSAQTRWGALIRLETGLDGLGVGDFQARTARFEIRIPFGATGRTGANPLAQNQNRSGIFSNDCSSIHAGYESIATGQNAQTC